MNWFLGIIASSLILAATLLFSIIYLGIKKYTETLAKLSAEDYYKTKIK